jgi:hypothetical protein
MGRKCSTHGNSAYRVLVRKPDRKRPLMRPKRRWEDNVRMELREIIWIGFMWLGIVTSESLL